jgi:hypothetical protein
VYLRESRRRNKDGPTVSYLQLAHNERHPETGSPVAKVIYNFGRADKVDREALRRLVASISRFLEPGEAVAALAGSDVEIVDVRRLGGAWALDRLWERLGISQALLSAARGRRLDAHVVERTIFALAANRALEPSSKLAATKWAAERAHVPDCPVFDDDGAYAAMDFLLDALGEIAKGVFEATANLLNLSCDIIFVDTTSTYFEVDVADSEIEMATAEAESEPAAQLSAGLGATEAATRRFNRHSKDHRPGRPQVVIAMAVTAEGVPVRCWTFPGNTSDQLIIRRVKDDLAGWMLHRVVWVADSGFNSAANRAYLERGGGSWIVAEKLRHTNTEAAAALARAGRYKTVAGNLRVKEARVGAGVRSQRFVVCHDPETAERDRQVRANLVDYLKRRIAGSDSLSRPRRDQLAGELRATPGLYRLLRRTKDGKLRVDMTAVKDEARFDGKWLIRTNDEPLSSEDLALAYKQLLAVERGWRDMKGALKLRPVSHWREDRVRAHVQLCWLALLLIRVVENATGDTWRNVRHELDRMHLVTLESRDGRVAQRSMTTAAQRRLFAALGLPEPPQLLDVELPTPAA